MRNSGKKDGFSKFNTSNDVLILLRCVSSACQFCVSFAGGQSLSHSDKVLSNFGEICFITILKCIILSDKLFLTSYYYRKTD